MTSPLLRPPPPSLLLEIPRFPFGLPSCRLTINGASDKHRISPSCLAPHYVGETSQNHIVENKVASEVPGAPSPGLGPTKDAWAHGWLESLREYLFDANVISNDTSSTTASDPSKNAPTSGAPPSQQHDQVEMDREREPTEPSPELIDPTIPAEITRLGLAWLRSRAIQTFSRPEESRHLVYSLVQPGSVEIFLVEASPQVRSASPGLCAEDLPRASEQIKIVQLQVDTFPSITDKPLPSTTGSARARQPKGKESFCATYHLRQSPSPKVVFWLESCRPAHSIVAHGTSQGFQWDRRVGALSPLVKNLDYQN
ncbi:hypothetical protein IE53DRAFT_385648 [Violaceomyces palustris]|uniref:Uncharacterized protein n=1 Tax=Violaceomyces palustris TaxID=1673888 RepID=A0ACD0P1S1_9BASI|nr:hypothetical protein IE53DRAFT_385648 [Violaceomyces palustris]